MLSCSDSRVPPELIFDAGLGDLFVVRSAGEDDDAILIGSLEYAVEHLGSTVIVVMGHQGCGAVTAACSGGKSESDNLEAVVSPIAPSCAKMDRAKPETLDLAVRDHVHRVSQEILASSELLRKAAEEHKLAIIEAYYSLDTGEVTRLHGCKGDSARLVALVVDLKDSPEETMKKPAIVLVMGTLLLFIQSAAFAQKSEPSPSASAGIEQDVQLLRSDIRSAKKQIIAENMKLTDTQAEKFWPVYDAYTQETTKLGDASYALVKEYAQNYNDMTDAQADSLAKKMAALGRANCNPAPGVDSEIREGAYRKADRVVLPIRPAH